MMLFSQCVTLVNQLVNHVSNHLKLLRFLKVKTGYDMKPVAPGPGDSEAPSVAQQGQNRWVFVRAEGQTWARKLDEPQGPRQCKNQRSAVPWIFNFDMFHKLPNSKGVTKQFLVTPWPIGEREVLCQHPFWTCPWIWWEMIRIYICCHDATKTACWPS